MSRLRRADLHSRFFFVTTNLLRGRRPFNDREFTVLATILDRTRRRLPFALCGYCFMPDHIHAIVFPEETTTISNVMKSFKLATFQSLKRSGDRPTAFWQSRFYDHALRSRQEYDDALDYMHMNPVRRGLVSEPREWRWSSARWIAERVGPMEIDFLRLPSEPKARL